MLINEHSFLNKYSIEEEKFKKTGLSWELLSKIYDSYLVQLPFLKPIENMFAEYLRTVNKVHSVKTRLKNPEHLIEKIIRKSIEDSEIEFTVENYKDIIKDIIGVRVLHLFKEDWECIHDYIIDQWELYEKPIANVRDGDLLIKAFEEKDCKINIHKYGYRSIHYIALTNHGKNIRKVEIQVRTIFEEGWSEIDHTIRYPYDMDNPILKPYLIHFNRLAGSADEMGSYIMFLKGELDRINDEHIKTIKEKDAIIRELEEKISELEVDSSNKEELLERVNTLKTNISKGSYDEGKNLSIDKVFYSKLHKRNMDIIAKMISNGLSGVDSKNNKNEDDDE